MKLYCAESLSARRAWIEILIMPGGFAAGSVALRKESVDRNIILLIMSMMRSVALRKESVDRNSEKVLTSMYVYGRSPQGERG